MSFNSLGQYNPTHKAWDHVGNNLPSPEYCEGTRPGFDFQVASWLPVQFYDKKFEDWVVVTPGKLLALDPDGYVMPAQYGLTTTASHVVYTNDDVATGTIDIATGAAVTTAKTVELSELTGAKGAGWTAALAGTSGYTSGFMGKFGPDFALGVGGTARYPIGVAPQAYLQNSARGGTLDGGTRNPANNYFHNYSRQVGVPVLCDAVLQLPLVPGQVTSETVDTSTAGSALVIGTQATHTRSEIAANDRYNPTTGTIPITSDLPVIALALDNYPIAKNTTRTTITLSSTVSSDDDGLALILVNEKSSVSGLLAEGDFWVDTDAGVIFIYSNDGSTVPSGLGGATGTITSTYYHYASAAGTISGTSISRFGCVVSTTTELRPGDFVGCGSDSNWVRLGPGSNAEATIVGQVLGFETFPGATGLDKVRTAYNNLTSDATGAMSDGAILTSSTGLGHMDQMPGTANGGVPASIHYAGAADLLVIINMINR